MITFGKGIRRYTMIAMSTEAIRRRDALVRELESDIWRELWLARSCHWGSLLFLFSLLAASVLAGALGFFTNTPSKTIGGIAILPPLIAYVAVNVKLEAKNSWHARMVDGLRRFRSRLVYELPEFPALEQIAEIAKKRQEFEEIMQAEWDKTLLVDWTGILKRHPSTLQSNVSLRDPNK